MKPVRKMLTARTPFVAAGTRPITKARSSVIMQARPAKAAEFRGLDNAEILQKVAELKRESMRLQYMQRTRGNVVNPGAVSWGVFGCVRTNATAGG